MSALWGMEVRERKHGNVLLIASYMLDGYEAKVQGGERYIERLGIVSYDDGPWDARYEWREKQPAVVLTRGDEVVLFVTVSRENAEALYAAALEDVESILG